MACYLFKLFGIAVHEANSKKSHVYLLQVNINYYYKFSKVIENRRLEHKTNASELHGNHLIVNYLPIYGFEN